MLSSQLQDPDYKLRHAGESRAREVPMKQTLSEIAERFAPEVQREENDDAGLREPPSRSAPTADTRRGLPLKALTAGRDRRCPHSNDNPRPLSASRSMGLPTSGWTRPSQSSWRWPYMSLRPTPSNTVRYQMAAGA